MSEKARSQNWRIRDEHGLYFIEADIPNAVENGHFPRVEVMQEDYGDHNGYTEEMRKADAELIVKAPLMESELQELRDRVDPVEFADWLIQNCYMHCHNRGGYWHFRGKIGEHDSKEMLAFYKESLTNKEQSNE